MILFIDVIVTTFSCCVLSSGLSLSSTKCDQMWKYILWGVCHVRVFGLNYLTLKTLNRPALYLHDVFHDIRGREKIDTLSADDNTKYIFLKGKHAFHCRWGPRFILPLHPHCDWRGSKVIYGNYHRENLTVTFRDNI